MYILCIFGVSAVSVGEVWEAILMSSPRTFSIILRVSSIGGGVVASEAGAAETGGGGGGAFSIF